MVLWSNAIRCWCNRLLITPILATQMGWKIESTLIVPTWNVPGFCYSADCSILLSSLVDLFPKTFTKTQYVECCLLFCFSRMFSIVFKPHNKPTIINTHWQRQRFKTIVGCYGMILLLNMYWIIYSTVPRFLHSKSAFTRSDMSHLLFILVINVESDTALPRQKIPHYFYRSYVSWVLLSC